MRIGIDAKWYFNGPVSGRVMLVYLMPYLIHSAGGHQWYIFLDAKDRDKDFPFKNDDIRIVYLNAPTNMFSNLFVLPRKARKLKLDVVVFQTFPAIGRNFKSIAFIHDILFKRFPQYFTWKEKLYFIPLPFFTRRADRVIATTHFVRKELLTYKFVRSLSQVDIIPLGVSSDFKPLNQHDEELVRRTKFRYHLPDEYILIVGRLNARKNIESLIMALSLLKNKSIPLVIVGKEDWKKSEFRNLIENPEIRERIFVTGSVRDDEIAILYAMAKIFCYPSFAEGFGLPPLEAMASGVPVVVSNTTSMPEICGEAAVYADPHQPGTIATAIDRLLENQVFYEKMKGEGLARAAQFNWIETANKLLECILNTVKQ